MNPEKQDVYTRITDKIIADLEKGVRPWLKPWDAGNTAGKITRPLRHNGQPYSGINILMLWASAIEQGFTAPRWMTFRQAVELNAHVRKGEKGSLVVYANAITRTEANDAGEETEREIHFMKGYTVFNVEQIEGLPEIYHHKHESKLTPVERIAQAEEFFAATGADIRYRGDRAFYASRPTISRCPSSRPSAMPNSFTPRSPMKLLTGRSTPAVSPATSEARAGATKAMPARNWSPSCPAPFSPPTLALCPRCGTTMPPTSPRG